jgi:hypothetical protein
MLEHICSYSQMVDSAKMGICKFEHQEFVKTGLANSIGRATFMTLRQGRSASIEWKVIFLNKNRLWKINEAAG